MPKHSAERLGEIRDSFVDAAKKTEQELDLLIAANKDSVTPEIIEQAEYLADKYSGQHDQAEYWNNQIIAVL